MSRQYDFANTYRKQQNRRFRNRANRKFFLKDISYFFLSALIIASYFNSLTHIRYVNVPVVQKVHAQAPIYPYTFDAITHITPSPLPLKDSRAVRLHDFFTQKGSPLADYAQRFVSDADKYGLDYTLMPAISCKESGCGLQLPSGSYNPFGLGGSNFMWFNSWEEAIDYEAQLLSSDYRGNMVAAIGSKYCPASDNCAPNWAEFVTATQFEIINK